MSSKPSFGLSSIACGCLALLFTLVASYWTTFINLGEGRLLALMERLGLVRQPAQYSFNSIDSPGWLSFTDEKALTLLYTSGAMLAVLAIALAVFAERRRESSLYLSAGLICGASSLVFWEAWGAFAALLVGGAIIIRSRNER